MIYKKRLKELRAEKELKLKEMALVINKTTSTYSTYEAECNTMPIELLNIICNYFDVSIDYIFDLTNIKQYDNKKLDIDIKLSSERLKEFRKENKLTQQKLADILTVHKSTPSIYEKGKYIIPTMNLYTICSKYNISADYLLGKTDSPKYLK